jgi:lipopolysaccharide export system permease protein
MRILDRYIARTVVGATMLAMLTLLALFFFIDLVDELADLGKGDYGVLQIVHYLLLIQPRRIYELFPLAALLGSILGLGALASNSELVAMRGAGVSLLRLIGSVMKIALWMMLAVVLIGEWIAPPAEQRAQAGRAVAQSAQITLKTQYGFWTRDGLSFINIRTILPGGQLRDVFIYEFDEQRRLRVATHAAQAVYEKNQWVLENVRQSYVGEQGVTTRATARAAWASPLIPELISAVTVKPENLSSWGLYKYIRYLRDNWQNSQRHELAFWKKLFLPLVTGVMVFIAIPFVFGVLRTSSTGTRVLAGCLTGVGFHLFNQIFSNASQAYGLDPLFGAAFPALLFLLIACSLLVRMYWRRA